MQRSWQYTQGDGPQLSGKHLLYTPASPSCLLQIQLWMVNFKMTVIVFNLIFECALGVGRFCWLALAIGCCRSTSVGTLDLAGIRDVVLLGWTF